MHAILGRLAAGTLGLAALLALTACKTPRGMYGHRPEELWVLPCADADCEVPTSSYAGEPIVLKAFENLGFVPVGAHFLGAEPADQSMTQSYAPAQDLAPAIYSAVFRGLRRAKFPVWQDRVACAQDVVAPPGTERFVVVSGIIEELELDTFAPALDLHEAARARVRFVVHSTDGSQVRNFQVEAAAKIARGAGDVLEALGLRIARKLAEVINGGLRA
jgi:hypothetical protein